MGIDPRNITGASEGQAAARLADVERRASSVESAAKVQSLAGAPPAPSTLTVPYDAGDTEVIFRETWAPGTMVVDSTNNRAYFWTGAAWKYTAIV